MSLRKCTRSFLYCGYVRMAGEHIEVQPTDLQLLETLGWIEPVTLLEAHVGGSVSVKSRPRMRDHRRGSVSGA